MTREELKQLIEETVFSSIQHAAMELEAIRVNSLMAENQALKLRIIALEQFVEYMAAKEQMKHGSN